MSVRVSSVSVSVSVTVSVGVIRRYDGDLIEFSNKKSATVAAQA